MLTVTLLLSGPHRHAMLETAFDSIPIESPAVSEVLVRHQGGPWNWGGSLRERILAHPKVRLLEFPDKVGFTKSFNRTLDAVTSPWALLLPDDDFLVRAPAKAAFEFVANIPQLQGCGFIAFGWYYLQHGRYLPNQFAPATLAGLLQSTPKCCSTLLNLRRVRQLGGFSEMGGFIDIELFARLAYQFDAAIVPARVGVYREHEGQESARLATVFQPYVESMRQALGRYAKNARERGEFERALWHVAKPRRPPAARQLKKLSFMLRSQPRPSTEIGALRIRKWSSG